MSDDDEKVGRGKPPKHTRFQPGQSGNRKGRPRKVPRAEVPSQILEDVRLVAQMEVVIKTAKGPQKVPGAVAVFYGLMKRALDGQPTALRIFLALLERAYGDNVKLDPILYLADYGLNDRLMTGLDENQRAELHAHLARRSKKPRASR